VTPPLLDTSFLVRYLTGDPPDQATTAAGIIDGGTPLALSGTVLAETAHVLRSVYRVPREAIVDALVAVVTRDTIQLLGLDRSTAIEALLLCRPSGRVSVPDAITWAEARTCGAGAVYTFDLSFPGDGIAINRG
jgi:predicted nucleic acid-binding protein